MFLIFILTKKICQMFKLALEMTRDHETLISMGNWKKPNTKKKSVQYVIIEWQFDCQLCQIVESA